MKTKKLLFLLVYFIGILNTIQLYAQNELPYMPLKDNFGGSVVNLSTFVPSPGNFTLDVMGSANTPISINYAGINYTPTTTGKIRFVRNQDQVYVFENGRFKLLTAVTPNPQYTVVGSNLIQNGSFETATLFSGSTNRWQASLWETWDGGSSTWGSETGDTSVREDSNYRSQGTKSIIMHSRTRHLMQKLPEGALQSNSYYLLTYNYWTSAGTGNGGTTYKINLGTNRLFTDIKTFTAHTTDETGTTQRSFSLIFQAPANVGSSVWFDFYRELSRVDWLDNIQLVRIVPNNSGITGATSALYLQGAIFAPENLALSGEEFMNMNSHIVNQDFNDALNSWNVVTGSKISTSEKAGGLIPGTQNHAQIYVGEGVSGRFFQSISNLPNGKYVLKAAVSPYFSGTVNLFANTSNTAITSGVSKYYETTGIVFNGKLEIGLALQTTASTTVDFDNFSLKYLGIDVDAYLQVLADKKQLALADVSRIQNSSDLPGYNNLSQYNSALNNANNLPNNDANTLVSAITQLDLAMNEYHLILAAYEPLKTVIADFTAELNASSYPDKSVFTTAIATAKAVYDSTTDQRANLASTIVNLEAKRKIIKDYKRLSVEISTATLMLNNNNYSGKSAFESAIAIAQSVYLQPVGEDLNSVIMALQDAETAYYNSQFTSAAVQETVSWVDTDLNGEEKFVLRVDGKPWYMTAIQVRLDKLKGYITPSFNAAAREAVIQKCAQDGFNTVQIPIMWSEVEPSKDKFDWTIIDEYMGYCKKYGLKLEILWYSWSSGGRIQYLSTNDNTLRTPDYVCSKDGTSEFTIRNTTNPWTLDWYDDNLLNRETYVLSKVFEHIAVWDANNQHSHTVIGVQLGNEPHGWDQTVSDSRIIDYYSKVGSAVKNSKYVVWTRLNNISWENTARVDANEAKRNNGGTNIDFVGIDIYGTDASNMKNNDYHLSVGKNYPMVMESDAKVSGAPIYQMAAFAGNKAYSHYNYAIVDGNSLYSGDVNGLIERAHTNDVRLLNKTINLDIADLAVKKNGASLYVYNYNGKSTAVETGLESIGFTPSVITSHGIAVRRSESKLVIMSTKGGTFTYPATLKVIGASKGYFNKDNQWVNQGNLTLSGNSIVLEPTSAVLLDTEATSNGISYKSVINRNSGKVLEVKDASLIDGAVIQQWNYTGDNRQQWQLSDNGNGFFNLIAKHSGKVIRSVNDKAVQWVYDSTFWTEQFEMIAVGDFFQFKNRSSGKCIQVTNGSVNNGEIIECAPCNSQNWSQQFLVTDSSDDAALAFAKKYFNEQKELAEINAGAIEVPGFYNYSGLNSAIANANTINLEAASLSTLQVASDVLKTSNDLANSIIVAYEPLKRTIKEALYYALNTNYTGKPAFEVAIATAQSVYSNSNDQRSNINNAITSLNNATIAYKATRPSEWVTIKNGALWKDENGNSVQAHGAGFLQVGDTWYMIGEDRTNQWNPDVNMYSSKDLVNWKFERKIIKNGVTHPDLGTSRFIERPKLLRCPKTGQFVVWCHWESGNYGASEVAVFYSDTINGDYKFHWSGRPLGIKSRDCNIFADDDGTAYFISTTSENTDLGLFRLSDDYLSVVEHTVLFPKGYREAPAIVRLNDTYFMISSALTGWDPNQGKIAYSKSLTSGWSTLSNVGNGITFDTQAASILTLKGSEKTTYVYVGDRWQDPGLAESKTIMFPISFDGNTCTFNYTQQFDMDLATGQTRKTSEENRISKTGWMVRAVSSAETSSQNAPASNAIDGNLSTMWHTKYSGTVATAPHSIEIDMGAVHQVSGFLAAPRLDNSTNGLIRNFEFYVSSDGTNWKLAAGGSWLPYYSEVYFTPTAARYFKLVSNAGTYASLAEIDILQNTPQIGQVNITPYYQIDGGNWTISDKILVRTGSTLKVGPQPSAAWIWKGPNGFTSTNREFTINNIQLVNSGIYTGLFLDKYNEVHKLEIEVTVKDIDTIAPSIVAPEDITVTNDTALCSSIVDLGIATANDNESFILSNDAPIGRVFAEGVHTVTWTAVDPSGNSSSDVQLVTVINNKPVITDLKLPNEPVKIDENGQASVMISASFTDNNLTSVTIDWGDGFVSEGTIGSDNTIQGNHLYSSPGIYQVGLFIEDSCGAKTELLSSNYITVYDENAGFLTGGGWFYSPMGAYKLKANVQGKAEFNFNIKFQKGSTIPKGNAELKLKAANMDFKSDSYEWLVIADDKAQFKGSGSINGVSDYDFFLTVVDGNPDKLRVMIWKKSTGQLIYDNNIEDTNIKAQPKMTIGGGQIVIHDEKIKIIDKIVDNISLGVYPNPTTGLTTLKLLPGEKAQTVRLYNMLGLEYPINLQTEDDNLYKVNLQSYASGVYILKALLTDNQVKVYLIIKK